MGEQSDNDVEVKDLRLGQAAFNGDVDEVRRLLDDGHDVEGPSYGGTPLHAAVENAKPEVVRLLLDHGADVNGRGPNGWTPLLHAVDGACDAASQLNLTDPPPDTIEVIRLLLSRGADPGLVDRLPEGDRTAAQIAAVYDRQELAQFLAVMQLVRGGMTASEISDRLPGVEAGDVQACLDFVSRREVRTPPSTGPT